MIGGIMFEKKTIISYESIYMRISGMRLTQEYEILHKDSGSEISDYWMRCASSGGMERELQRRVFCSDSQMLELLNQCDILKWDGFHGKHPRGVLDGEMFSFEATVNGGETIRADGSANFPKNFREFRRAVDQMLSEADNKTTIHQE